MCRPLGALQKASIGCFGLMIGALAACESGPAPGEYVVYRIASSQEQLSDGCFSSGVPVNEKEDTITWRNSGLFLLFAGADDEFYLDTGLRTYDGQLADSDVYLFEADEVDVDFSCSDGTGDRITASSKISIDLVIDGALAEGKMRARTSYDCVPPEGADPDETACGVEIPSCTVTVDFIGVEVEDVELKHEIGSVDGSPVPKPVSGEVPEVETPYGYGGTCEPSCSHNECVIGGPLDPVCNACADIVCLGVGEMRCCRQSDDQGEGWNEDCVGYANDHCGPEPGVVDHCPEA